MFQFRFPINIEFHSKVCIFKAQSLAKIRDHDAIVVKVNEGVKTISKNIFNFNEVR